MRILIVEDDKVIREGLEYSLIQENYQVDCAGTVQESTKMIKSNQYDLLLLDLGLPDGTGYELCKLAKTLSDVAVIFLTACDEEVNIVMGLDMGADDYIIKPFRVRELLSRIKSVLRRMGKKVYSENILLGQGIRVNINEAKVYKNNENVFLTALEYRLLLLFVKNIGQVLSRSQLLGGIWDVTGDYVNDNTLTVYIKRLREKLEDTPQEPDIIKTVRGLGYIIEKKKDNRL